MPVAGVYYFEVAAAGNQRGATRASGFVTWGGWGAGWAGSVGDLFREGVALPLPGVGSRGRAGNPISGTMSGASRSLVKERWDGPRKAVNKAYQGPEVTR